LKLALTYDDGPSRWTFPLLGVLREYEAKATFFVVGKWIKGREDILQTTLIEGHEIGNHTWTHPEPGTKNYEELRLSLAGTSYAIEEATGKKPTLCRAPHLSRDPIFAEAALSCGLQAIGATVGPADWLTEDPQVIAGHVLDHVRDGSIVCLHDGPDEPTIRESCRPTVDATRIILEELRGSEFVSVSNL
jgi:peptidoglycan/xylan/chitin deacetylase (PgdA/CDA1 family)